MRRAPDAVVFSFDAPGGDVAGLATELGPVLDTVLVGGEWRVVGAVSAEDLEELGRMADVGDELRAESRLALLRRGRPV